MYELVEVFAPATVANVGVAFDVLGFAIDGLGDSVIVRRSPVPGIVIEEVAGDDGRLSRDPSRNTAGVAVKALLEHLGKRNPTQFKGAGVSLWLEKGLPLGSGLGSSAASAASGVVAVNELLGGPLTRAELVPFAMQGELIACGTAHADNVAPSLMGGFTLIRSYSPLDIIALHTPAELYCAVTTPHFEVRTEDARRILRKSVSLQSAVTQWGNIAALVAALFREDYALLGRSLEDGIIEPERSALIPAFDEVKAAALASGALGCSISGSGPTIFALARGLESAREASAAMAAAFRAADIECSSHVSAINLEGARVLRRER